MNKINIIKSLSSVVARRNTALTIIENNDISKTIQGIERRISCIKHKQKRSQLMYVIRELKDRIKRIGSSYGIFCIGIQMNGELYYQHIDVKPNFSDYQYDDVFDVFKISQVLFNLLPATNQEIQGLTEFVAKSLTQNEGYEGKVDYFVNQEINSNLDDIGTIYHITESKNPAHVPIQWLERSEKITVKLIIDHKFDSSSPLSIFRAIATYDWHFFDI